MFVFPFTAIVGQEKAKLALLCNAVNPAIGGVLLSGDKGTGKSTMVRALADVLPEIEVVKGCPFNCNPHNELEMCDACREKARRGEIEIERRRMRVVDLPLSVSVDRLVGTIDVERVLKDGVRALQPGILAEANRNILYIDEVNLLEDYIVDLLLDASAMGWNVVEREGISLKHPSRFILVGSMNPEEGELRPQILDRFGLFVEVEALRDVEARMEVLRRVEEFQNDPIGFLKKYEGKQKELRRRVARAREMVRGVEIGDDLIELLVKTIVDMGIRTHRAEITTIRTAKAISALEGRRKVKLEDLERAMELALPHRRRDRPFENVGGKGRNGGGGRGGGSGGEKDAGIAHVSLDVPKGKGSGKDVSRGSRDVKRMEVRGIGYPVYALPYSGGEIDVFSTILNALSKGRKIVSTEDLMERVKRVRLKRLTVILLDASGSMYAMRRIEIAKGIAKRFIENCYVKRDLLSLIAFKGTSAELIVPPTRRYSDVLSALERIKVGGRTPLPSALSKLLGVSRGFKGVVRAVLITDGKANVPVMRGVREDIESLAKAVSRRGIDLIVYDTRRGFEPSYIELISRITGAEVRRIVHF